jgi:hypothetical protein
VSNEETTYQRTLVATARADAERKAALERIQLTMEPAAQAMAASRTPGNDYWIKEEHQIEDLGVTLHWSDQGSNEYRHQRKPYDTDKTYRGRSWSTQICGADLESPEVLQRIAVIARIRSEEIRRKYEAITIGQVAALEAEASAFAAIEADK